MVESKQVSEQGSIWRRWDPHIHSPGTVLNDQYKNWEEFLTAVEKTDPPIEAIGVTDYFCIEGYKKAKEHRNSGRMPNVGFIFPNVELRLDIKTEKAKGINIHLLFSPQDCNHEQQIQRLLSGLSFELNDREYRCDLAGLEQLGKDFSRSQLETKAAIEVGANQFKATIKDIKKLLKDPWAQKNCLVAVSGSGVDGTAGLQSDDSFKATRQNIERMAHIIFSGNPKQREFWLGKGVSSVEQIESTYGFLKPCLHGSDAHQEEKVGNPTQDRYCWIKGDLSFETLRQVVIEPEKRASITSERPKSGMDSYVIKAVKPEHTDWLANSLLPLNSGLVAIIGARGSGKTALADMIAAGSSAITDELPDSSFLARAKKPVNYLLGSGVQLEWGNGDYSKGTLDIHFDHDFETISHAETRYLSQQFVDRLCSAAGLANELREEIERVIFEAIDPVERLETDAFIELSDQLLRPIRSTQQQARERIEKLSSQIATEDIAMRKLPGLQQQEKKLSDEIDKLKKEITALLPKDKARHIKELQAIQSLHRAVQERLEQKKLQQQKLSELHQYVANVREFSEPARWEEMRQAFFATNLSDGQWEAFKMVFSGDVDQLITAAKTAVDKEITVIQSGDPGNPIDPSQSPADNWPLESLAAKLKAAAQAVGIDEKQQKQYDRLQQKITAEEAALRRLKEQIKQSADAEERRQTLMNNRRETYLEVFKGFVQEEEVLQKLYAPLASQLEDAEGALAKLKFVVYRRVNIKAWADKGESFIDLRTPEKLRGKGKLHAEAERLLLNAWIHGSPSDVAKAMDDFQNEFKRDFAESIPKSLSIEQKSQRFQEIAAWLYDTSYVSIEYGIEFDGTAIEQLSPGTRGIVLLLLYLVIDKNDQRPLIVDQPEENLDPQSVYNELVPHFREACKRRQIILVTHNANLVVNTDADQVIVANATRENSQPGLPTISYKMGSLENSDIRQAVCNILEGGNRAFLERERRYRFRWDETISDEK